MEIVFVVPGIIAALIVITAVRAIFFVPGKSSAGKKAQDDEKVDVERFCQNLSDAIKIKTVSN